MVVNLFSSEKENMFYSIVIRSLYYKTFTWLEIGQGAYNQIVQCLKAGMVGTGLPRKRKARFQMLAERQTH